MKVNVEDDIPLHVDVTPNVVEVATPSVVERENQVTNTNRLSLIKDKEALEKDITDKDFLISSQNEVIENMRAKFEAVSESSAITADELVEKLKAVEEERNSLIKMMKSKDQNIDELSVAIENLRKKQTNQEDGDNSELHALRDQYDVAYRESIKREELLLQARTSLKNATGELEVLRGKLKNAEIELHLKDGLADLQKKEIASLQNELQKKELEKGVSKELAETLPTETGDLSKQLVTLRAKCKQDLADKQLLLTKTELVVKTKDELLEAKQEIVENLRFRIGILQKEKKNEKNGQSDLTSKTNSPVDEVKDASSCANGVDDACEFIKVYAKGGVIINGFLLWANIQRLTKPEKVWKDEAAASFLKTEITDAKESLWRVCGDKIAMPAKKRQGPSKSISEVDDIAKALKLLAEKESLPMFLATGDMVKETPISSHPTSEIEDEKKVLGTLKRMENALQVVLAGNDKSENQVKGENSNTDDDGETEQNKNRNVVSWAAEDDVDLGQNEEWIVPKPKKKGSASTNNSTGKRSWKDKLTILQGTATGGTHEIPQSADVHLVAYGLGKDTTAEQLATWLQSNGLQVKSCILLTKYEGARSLAYKISIKSSDYDKATNPHIWPDKVGVRRYKFFDKQKNTSVQSSGRSNFSQPWKTQNSTERQNGFMNFMPPSNGQVNAFYQGVGSSRRVGFEQNRNVVNQDEQHGNSVGEWRQNVGNIFPSGNHQGELQYPNQMSFGFDDGMRGGGYRQ